VSPSSAVCSPSSALCCHHQAKENLELRMKYADEPMKFLENEVDLLSLIRGLAQVRGRGGTGSRCRCLPLSARWRQARCGAKRQGSRSRAGGRSFMDAGQTTGRTPTVLDLCSLVVRDVHLRPHAAAAPASCRLLLTPTRCSRSWSTALLWPHWQVC
jgi:hypothetical protein